MMIIKTKIKIKMEGGDSFFIVKWTQYIISPKSTKIDLIIILLIIIINIKNEQQLNSME